jgi:hypothetical protein
MLVFLSCSMPLQPPAETPTSEPGVGEPAQIITAVPDQPLAESTGQCLLGTWELTPESFDPYIRSIISSVTRLNTATVDRMTLTFDGGTQLAAYTWENAVVDSTKVGLSSENSAGGISPDTQMVMTINGTTTSPFNNLPGDTASQGNVTFGSSEGQLTIQIVLNGIDTGSEAVNAGELGWAANATAAYECSGDTLNLTPLIEGIQVSPMRLHRIN